MTFRIQFAPAALEQLEALEDHIEAAGSPLAAVRYVDAIVAYCETLASFPMRGIKRDDVLPGLRITNFRGTTIIALHVDDQKCMVSIPHKSEARRRGGLLGAWERGHAPSNNVACNLRVTR
ncbi:MAG TPA: plasmid stabilization protein [Achromobacter sp.]|nr:plasmid stabilization protein [Achromobacter sp.]